MSTLYRLTDLEIRLTHQEETIDELNKTVYEQWKMIERLNNEIDTLKDRFKTMTQDEIDDVPYVPPHY